MSEQQKPQAPTQQPPQSQQQLQALKQTIKENKILQSKNSKLEAKYVQLFKQQKAVKKDHSVFVAFLAKLFNGEGSAEAGKQAFQEVPIGQYQLAYFEKLAYEKESASKKQIEDLTLLINKKQTEQKDELQRTLKGKSQEMVGQFQAKMKKMKEESSKEMNGYLKELEQFKRLAKNQIDELNQLRNTLQLKNNELSKISKEKLKLEHHLNNIRKKEIAEELNPQKQKEQEKIMSERNEFLSLRQQVESLMGKRDELKRLLKDKESQLAAQRKKNQLLQQQLTQLKQSQREQDEKYELIRQCSLQELQNLILSHHFDAPPNDSKPNSQLSFEVPKKPQEKVEDSDQIQKQYLKNIMTRYIKAETSGAFDQALTLLEVIGTILKLDPQSSLALQHYKSKRKQWWYIKY